MSFHTKVEPSIGGYTKRFDSEQQEWLCQNNRKIMGLGLILLALLIGVAVAAHTNCVLDYLKNHQWECLIPAAVLGLLVFAGFTYFIFKNHPFSLTSTS